MPVRLIRRRTPNLMNKCHCLLLAFAVAWALSGCGEKAGSDRSDATSREDRRVTLFAAASTTDAVEEIGRQFEREHRIKVALSTAASSTLAQQIYHGAGADVYIAADPRWAEFLEESHQVAKRRDVLGNRLVVITPADSKIELAEVEDLLDPRIKSLALAEPESVPAGMYAREALVRLDLWKRLEGKVVAAADVRHALAYVESGDAEAGIVYATDAAASEAVRVAVNIDPELTGDVRYPIVLLESGKGDPAAEAFYEYLTSPRAAEVFQSCGFVVLTDSDASSSR